ncbi:MAG: hypothetical protein ACRDSM_20745, partial [Pseudonocardiaceae bacterium]
LLRVAWRSVSDIVTRVVAARAGQVDRLAGLRRIGIDEISYRKDSGFCWWWSITTPGGWSGPVRTATSRPWAGSSTSWVPGAPRT